MIIRPLLISLAVCSLFAGLEGLFAGTGIRSRMSELRQPPFSPPFGVWVGIGLLYYMGCFIVLFQLIRNGLHSAEAIAALVLILIIMALNALWNFFFFRKDVRAAFLLGLPYAMFSVALASLLF